MPDIKVGPVGYSYAYTVNGQLSERRYANAQSALFDARRPQQYTPAGTLVPEPEGEL